MLSKRKPPTGANAQTAITLAPRERHAAEEAQLQQRLAPARLAQDQARRSRGGERERARIDADVQPCRGPSMIA